MRPEDYLDPDVIRQVARLDLVARFLMEGFIAGLHRSPFKGFSAEFSEHRRYVPGDDIRTVDWKVFARTNRYYVKEFAAETNMECTLLIDTSGSMGYAGGGAAGLSKHTYGIYLAAALAYMMVRQKDPVGLVTFDAEVRDVTRPRCRASHLVSILKRLNDTRPQGRTGLAHCLHEAAGLIRQRGLVVLISDLMAEPAAVLDGLHHLAYDGHEVIVFHVLSSDERTLPFDRARRLVDMETGAELAVDPGALRNRYLADLAACVEGFRRDLLRRRIDYVEMDTATRFDKALLAYLVKRAKA